eukprot:TRINITY_DN2171_c0_g3_i1.p1 TRINITY_DN2171_c0_g3~~TRINITY_DN2171_c0_g3_i1.p1  ORF type:complete len:564 (+),score=140.27 TRINITY_DN2171_c0_g3_i1:37-1692(+)
MAARVLSINKPHKQQSLNSLGSLLPSSSSLGSVPTAHPTSSSSFHSISLATNPSNSNTVGSTPTITPNSSTQALPQPQSIPSSSSLPAISSSTSTTKKGPESRKRKLKNLNKHKSNKNAESIRAAELLLKDLQKRLQDEKSKKHRLRVQVETIKKAEQIVLRKLQELQEVVSNKSSIPSSIESLTLPATIGAPSSLKSSVASAQVIVQLQEQLSFVNEICNQETVNARESLNELCKVLAEKIAVENEVKVTRRQLALKGFRLKKGANKSSKNVSREEQPVEEAVFTDEESRVVMKQVATEREKAKVLVDEARQQLLEEFFPEFIKVSQKAQNVADEKERLQDELDLLDLEFVVEKRNNELVEKENKQLAMKLSKLGSLISSLPQKKEAQDVASVDESKDVPDQISPPSIVLSASIACSPTQSPRLKQEQTPISSVSTMTASENTTISAPSSATEQQKQTKRFSNGSKQFREYVLSLDHSTRLGRPLSQRFEEVVIVMEEPISAEEQSGLDSEFWHSSDEGDDSDFSNVNSDDDDDDDDDEEGESSDNEGEP